MQEIQRRDFDDIIELIKDYISNEVGERFVQDQDIAYVLDILPKQLASYKQKKNIPYQKVVDFAKKRRINIDSIYYKSITLF